MHRGLRVGLGIVLALAGTRCARPPAPAPPPPAAQAATARFEVTAYSIEGTTAKGTRARAGVGAADPKVLPLGSRVRIVDAGEDSGEDLVEDTGRAIKGQELDIYLADDGEAKRFGRRSLEVEIIQHRR
jgi:3D (Asp-Asp-Asp) domain-containing protein